MTKRVGRAWLRRGLAVIAPLLILAGPALCAAGDDEASVRAALDRVLAVNSGLDSYVAEVESVEIRGGLTREAVPVKRARFRVHWASPAKHHVESLEARPTALLTVDPLRVISRADVRAVGTLGHGVLSDHDVNIASLESSDPKTGTVLRTTMWIDANEGYVLQLRSYWNYVEFLTATFDYERVAGRFWLPAKVEMHFPRDDLTVVNRYTYQRVNAPVPPEVSERMR